VNICLSAKTLSADGVESESLLEFSASGCLLRVSLEAVGREAVTGTVVVRAMVVRLLLALWSWVCLAALSLARSVIEICKVRLGEE
jgi:hypothetical protein